MKWPWVSRRAYEDAIAERDRKVSREAYRLALDELERLREQNTALFEHLRRMDRVEHGVAETPRAHRPLLPPMPREVLDYCKSFADRRTRQRLRTVAREAAQRAGTWEGVLTELKADEPPQTIAAMAEEPDGGISEQT